MSVYHTDVPGQPNGRLGHDDAWSMWCPICNSESAYERSAKAAANAMDQLVAAVKGVGRKKPNA